MSSIGMRDFPEDYVRYYDGGEGNGHYQKGWYFEDETNDDHDNGPYPSKELCIEALEEYARHL